MKKCPFCAEEIQDEAIVCRFCGRDLPLIKEQTQPIKIEKLSLKQKKLQSRKLPKKKNNIWVIVLVILIFIICGYIFFNAMREADSTSVISTNLKYTFINKEYGTPATPKKCIFDIRIPERISKEELAVLANFLQQKEGTNCSPLFIYYFLPNEIPGTDTAWAYSQFNPELELGINGLDVDTKATLESIKPTANKNTVGVWADTGSSPHKIIISKINLSYEMTTIYVDGSSETKALVAKIVNGEERLYEHPGNYYGDYMVIKSNRNLAFYDNAGLIYEFPPE